MLLDEAMGKEARRKRSLITIFGLLAGGSYRPVLPQHSDQILVMM
ncbi:hypothetical protein [Cylindrospermum stagnale]|nr:hypothetical protein [Cylindrospermum stagnale]